MDTNPVATEGGQLSSVMSSVMQSLKWLNVQADEDLKKKMCMMQLWLEKKKHEIIHGTFKNPNFSTIVQDVTEPTSSTACVIHLKVPNHIPSVHLPFFCCYYKPILFFFLQIISLYIKTLKRIQNKNKENKDKTRDKTKRCPPLSIILVAP